MTTRPKGQPSESKQQLGSTGACTDLLCRTRCALVQLLMLPHLRSSNDDIVQLAAVLFLVHSTETALDTDS